MRRGTIALTLAGALSAVVIAFAYRRGGPRIVVDFGISEPERWEPALRQVANLRLSLPEAPIHVVVYGKAIPMLAGITSPVATALDTLDEQRVHFVACENTLRAQNVARRDLVKFADTVPSAVAELARRQDAGWVYVKL